MIQVIKGSVPMGTHTGKNINPSEAKITIFKELLN